MLKLSSLKEKLVYQCFLVAPFSEVTFLARESCVIQNASTLRHFLPFEASKQLLQSPLQKFSKVSTDLSMRFRRSKVLGE